MCGACLVSELPTDLSFTAVDPFTPLSPRDLISTSSSTLAQLTTSLFISWLCGFSFQDSDFFGFGVILWCGWLLFFVLLNSNHISVSTTEGHTTLGTRERLNARATPYHERVHSGSLFPVPSIKPLLSLNISIIPLA